MRSVRTRHDLCQRFVLDGQSVAAWGARDYEAEAAIVNAGGLGQPPHQLLVRGFRGRLNPKGRRPLQWIPPPCTSMVGSMPNPRSDFSHISSIGVWNTSSVVTSQVNQAPAIISRSS